MAQQESEENGIDFHKPWTYSNICFSVDEKRLYASKMILSMWSPVFEAMFGDDFKEKNAKEIKLPEKKYNDVLELLKVLHPPNKDIDDDNVLAILPLAQEYQIEKVTERCEEHLLNSASTIKNYLIAQQFNLKKLLDSNMSYLKRAPITRLKTQPGFDQLDKKLVIQLLTDKCEKFESNLDALREVRMVLERKKPTTFPGMHLLCDTCTEAREQQVECTGCMKSCCKKITEILRNVEK